MQHADLTIATEGRAPPSPSLAGRPATWCATATAAAAIAGRQAEQWRSTNATLRGLLGHLQEGDALLQVQLPDLVRDEDVVDVEATAAIARSRVRAFDRVLRIGRHTLLVVLPQAEPRSVQAVMNRLQPALDEHLPTGGMQIDLVMVGHDGGAIAYQELEQRLPA